MLTFIVLSVPVADDTRFLLPILPAVALLVGQLWAYHVHLASERQEDPDINRLRVPHWLMIIGVSFLGSAYAAFQPELIEAGYLTNPAEEKNLRNNRFLTDVAAEISRGIEEFLTRSN